MPTSPARRARNAALDRLFREFAPQLIGAIRRSTGAALDVAEDASLEAWTALVRRTDIDPCDERVHGWLYVVALNHIRSMQRRPRAEVLLPPGDKTPAEVNGTEELLDARTALRQLKDAETEALLLQAAGYSYREIADLTGSTYTAVNRRITEGRAHLRRICLGA